MSAWPIDGIVRMFFDHGYNFTLTVECAHGYSGTLTSRRTGKTVLKSSEKDSVEGVILELLYLLMDIAVGPQHKGFMDALRTALQRMDHAPSCPCTAHGLPEKDCDCGAARDKETVIKATLKAEALL